MSNHVYIATSIDGYIAKKNGDINWLHDLPETDDGDFGFEDFMNKIDALLMGRNTYEKILSFDTPWPYSKKVFVISSKMQTVPVELIDKVEFVKGDIQVIINGLNQRGYKDLYIDGGYTIQSLLKENLIDEITISKLPIILGEGIPLFKPQDKIINLEHINTNSYKNGIVKSYYKKK